jgi:hypothetical protein
MVNINHGSLDQWVFAPYISGARTHVQKEKSKMAEFHPVPVPFYYFSLRSWPQAGKGCAEMSCPYVDLKNNIVLWTDNLVSDVVLYKKT